MTDQELEVERLRGLVVKLRDFAEHRRNCLARIDETKHSCTCGFAEAMREAALADAREVLARTAKGERS